MPRCPAGVLIGACVLGRARTASSVAARAHPVERETSALLRPRSRGRSAGIVRRFVWRIKSGDESRVADQVKGDFSKISAADILQGARLGDGVSISVVRDTAKYVGMAVANLATMFDPEVVVLGGSIASSGDVMLEAIRSETQRRLMPQQCDRVRIELSSLGDDAIATRRGARRRMIALSGADTSLPDPRRPGRIDRHRPGPYCRDRATRDRCRRRPHRRRSCQSHDRAGLRDVHVHGIEGVDVLDGPDAVDDVAKRLPKYGVTAFARRRWPARRPRLTTLLSGVRARALGAGGKSGARPARAPRKALHQSRMEWPQRSTACVIYKRRGSGPKATLAGQRDPAGDRVEPRERRHHHACAGISGGLDLVRDMVMAGHRVSRGTPAADLRQARDAIALGCHMRRISSIACRRSRAN